jgi:ABC-type nitrate/sulfonate/bicarbonate transport system substrate-binding protein
VRIPAVIVLALALAACGANQSTSSFGEVSLVLTGSPGADEAGVFLATERGYDTGEGVTFNVARSGPADFRLVARPPRGCVAVLAVVRPDKLVLCADEITLQDERPKVLAVVRALQRGYTQAQMEPDEAVTAMTGKVPGLDRDELSTQLDEVAPTWTAGAKFFGELEPGPGRDSSVARDARETTY